MLGAAAMLGFAIGFVGSIPIAGPIAVLVLRRGLEDRARSAMYLALGAALAEGGYAYLAFWGFAAYLTRYSWIEPTSHAAAAVLLIGLGLRFLRRPDGEPPRSMPDPRTGNKGAFLLGLTITALNPALIAGWTAAVTALYSVDVVRFERAAALPFAVGACSGITLWFATLLGILQRVRVRVSRNVLRRAVRGTGVLLILLGLGFAARLV